MMSPTCILSMLRQMARRILPGVTATGDMRADLDGLVARGYRGVVSAETYDGRYFADPAAADAQVMAEYRRAIGA